MHSQYIQLARLRCCQGPLNLQRTLRINPKNGNLRCGNHPISHSSVVLSGHNKWSKIRHNKAIQDSKKNVLYNRLQRDIIIAVQTGGPDATVNPSLSLAIKKAKTMGLPKANLERTLAKARTALLATSGGETTGQDALYEVMTSDKVGLIVHCVTDNPARARQALNKIVKDNGARFTPTAFLFHKKAVIKLEVPKEQSTAAIEKLWDLAIEVGAEDVVNLSEEMQDDPGSSESSVIEVEIVAPPDLLTTVATLLSQPPHSYNVSESEVQWRPSDPEAARATAEALSDEAKDGLQTLIQELEESPECVGVWCSID
ncbi:YebC-like protein [Serendipita vermifera]|nr:YebC-like protein [Serendipita vermifera]